MDWGIVLCVNWLLVELSIRQQLTQLGAPIAPTTNPIERTGSQSNDPMALNMETNLGLTDGPKVAG